MAIRGKCRKKKEGRIPKDLVSADLLSKEAWHSRITPSDDSGEYIGKLLKEIRPAIGCAYHNAKQLEARPDYKRIVNEILDQMGFASKAWERGAIYSALSRETWKHRRKREADIKARIIEEARQLEAELHNLPD